jgi:hypothetical protein
LLQLRREPGTVGVHLGVMVRHGPQFIEHGRHVARHADLIGLGVVGLGLLDGALDVNGEGVRQDGQDACDRRLTARTAPMMTASPSVPLANLIGATSSCRSPNQYYGKRRGCYCLSHRRHHGRRALANSARAWSSSA